MISHNLYHQHWNGNLELGKIQERIYMQNKIWKWISFMFLLLDLPFPLNFPSESILVLFHSWIIKVPYLLCLLWYALQSARLILLCHTLSLYCYPTQKVSTICRIRFKLFWKTFVSSSFPASIFFPYLVACYSNLQCLFPAPHAFSFSTSVV